jgi:hypothetical protein
MMSSDLPKKRQKAEVWVNDYTTSPRIKGWLEISTSRNGAFIGGDPDGLRSLAKLLTWLADVDQEAIAGMPDGERCHVHLHAHEPVESFNSLTCFSLETEVCRLDAKGTHSFPRKYLKNPAKRPKQKRAKATTVRASKEENKG